MSAFLVVCQEGSGLDETVLTDTKEQAISAIQRLRDEWSESDNAMKDCTTIYEVVAKYNYEPPKEAAGLVNRKVFS